MEIVASYSFKSGKEFIEKHHRPELDEVKDIISSVEASKLKTKVSEEKTMKGKLLYSPKRLNKEFRRLFDERGWSTGTKARIEVKTYVPEIGQEHKGFREMDAIKNKVALKYNWGSMHLWFTM